MRQWYSDGLENRFPSGFPGSIPGLGVRQNCIFQRLANKRVFDYAKMCHAWRERLTFINHIVMIIVFKRYGLGAFVH